MSRMSEIATRVPLVRFVSARWRGELTGVRLFLVLVMVAAGCWLVFGKKPWIEGVGPAEAAGKDMRKPVPFAVDGCYYAAAFNLVVAGLLLAGSKWLVPPCAKAPGSDGEVRRASGAMGWLVVAGVLLASGIFARHAGPRLFHSFWVDEETTARQLVLGNYMRVGEDGRGSQFGEKVVVRPVPWSTTIWHYQTHNNHPFYSIVARTSHNVFSKISPPEPLHFTEVAFRLPVFLVGLGALGVFAFLLVRLGFSTAAMLAPLLMALHPWFIRFGSDARGYGFTFFFAPLCAVLLWRALQSGQWRYWSGLALCQFLLAWSHGSGVCFLVGLNLWGFAAPWLWRPGMGRGEALARNGRQFLASSVSAMLFLQLFLPNVLHQAHRMKGMDEGTVDATMAGMGWEKIRNVASWFFGGSEWTGFPEAGHPFSFTLPGRFGGATSGLWLFLVLATVLYGMGLRHFWRRGGATRWFPVVAVLPAPVMYAVSLANHFVFDHYFVIALPWVIVVLATGIAAVAQGMARPPRGPALPACVLGALAVALFWWVGRPQRDAYSSRSFEMNREAVERVRGSLDPDAPGYHDVLTAGLLRYPRTYDPYAYAIKTEEDIDRLVAMSDASGKPLYIYCGMGAYGAPIAALLDDRSRFTHVVHYHGLDGMTELDVVRHDPRPGAAGGAAGEAAD